MSHVRRRGFTLVELTASLIVLAVITGYLVFVGAHQYRAMARSGGCKANLVALARAVDEYVADQRYFPPAYVLGAQQSGISWNMAGQTSANPTNGFVHWSGLLSGLGYIVNESVYSCPDVLHSGAPNVNPGPIAANWEPGQVNEVGGGPSTALPNDRQAKRLAYVANGAIMPRNKFSGGSVRRNKFFDGSSPASSRAKPIRPSVVMLTEWAVLPGTGPTGGWSGLADGQGLYKTHRPITPFLGISAGNDVYNEPDLGTHPRFRYPTQSEILPANQLAAGFFAGGVSEINAVGRHHEGGTALFALMDESIQQMTVQQSVQQRLWGSTFHTITGRNSVAP